MKGGITENKKARFDYEILETFEAGIALTGHEARSIRSGHVNISGAHAIVRAGEIFLIGLQIPSFQPENMPEGYDAGRIRKLLLSKKEIVEISGKLKQGLTLIPLKLYNKKRFMKLELGLARGKKNRDKRETIKKRETDKEMRRSLKISAKGGSVPSGKNL